ncbi:thaumatin-like protein [Lentinus tigrinus ALCF2SS1-7]|uniref:Thaumatin-like protein n=1 Tax=Lentinus tigrinus ALCF2SS1-6 TaxID=1328759 RepID=A0A5C2SDH7_9APHY|nr:thaumatin-like protein [Lentinus tigrinus ALCF2SS1-6]RPD76001.1 thaumatin-like protein [Lentinus tigrinus ALCF2SS1-7]
MKSFLALTALAFVSCSAARNLTVVNNCAFTIWPAHFTDPTSGSSRPDYPTGWTQESHQSVSFSVPDSWIGGRIWARRECDFSANPGPNSCLDGGCDGGLECTGTGAPPATLAEFALGSAGGTDYVDVSIVDGFNLPMRISNNKGCPAPDCPVDLNPNCPAELKGPFDSSGSPVGCKSSCEAGLGDPVNNPNCCTGTHGTPATCPPSGVAYYSYFKGNCPNSYVFVYDNSGGAPQWVCTASQKADYTVTFCP